MSEHLWAPWRMDYIKDEQRTSGECIFCVKPAAEQDRGNLILLRSALNYVIMNRYPYNNGHLMVVPYEHASELDSLSDDVTTDMMATTRRCLKVLRSVMSPQGFNLGLNLGKAAGAGIDEHVHLHIVPRWSGDTNFMPVIGDVKIMPEHLMETYDKIFAGLQT